MLTAILLVVLAQEPSWSNGTSAAATVIEGSIELDRAEAEAAALRLARQHVQATCSNRAREIARSNAPAWMPDFVVRRVADDWVAAACDPEFRIVSAQTQVHDFTYGQAFRTSLRIATRAGEVLDSKTAKDLLRHVRAKGSELLIRLGGLISSWALLAFAYAWLDRLSRGYMTWRLRLLAAGLALVGIPIAVLV